MFLVGPRDADQPRVWVITTSGIKAVREAERTVKGCTLDVLNRLN